MFLINLVWGIIGTVLGFYVLFVGRRALWVTLGIIGLIVSANLLAVFVIGGERGRDLLGSQAWGLVGIAVLVGVLGFLLGRVKPEWAVLLIGFAAGADLALWFYDIAAYVITAVAQQSEQFVFWIGLLVIFIGGLFGVWLVRKSRDEALIVITMLIGVQLIQDSVGFSLNSSWTAIVLGSLALAGVLVQYAAYIRDRKAEQSEPAPHGSSIAYFQDLELEP